MKSKFQIILDINKKVVTLTVQERNEILEILKFHEAEPMAAAERISDLLNVDYSAIFELI